MAWLCFLWMIKGLMTGDACLCTDFFCTFVTVKMTYPARHLGKLYPCPWCAGVSRTVVHGGGPLSQKRYQLLWSNCTAQEIKNLDNCAHLSHLPPEADHNGLMSSIIIQRITGVSINWRTEIPPTILPRFKDVYHQFSKFPPFGHRRKNCFFLPIFFRF